MRTINSNPSPYKVGRRVVVTKLFSSGSVLLHVGDVGMIERIETHSLPDFGLFNVKVYDISFIGHDVSIGEGIVQEYMDPV
jgi:hypothetical protein